MGNQARTLVILGWGEKAPCPTEFADCGRLGYFKELAVCAVLPDGNSGPDRVSKIAKSDPMDKRHHQNSQSGGAVCSIAAVNGNGPFCADSSPPQVAELPFDHQTSKEHWYHCSATDTIVSIHNCP